MSTSLAEQLRRLAAPQTSILVDSKKRASILFDQKEAANKDREEIYEIGHAGLMELIAINPAFLQFEQTLFDKTAKNLERSIESDEVNQLLNKSIKKFFIHLAPYFPLQPVHKCIEWLIRRFHVQEFNKDEFLALIFPYHETLMFVKCVQIFNLKSPGDKWKWLEPIKKPGVKLAKGTVMNKAASDTSYLKFVCKTTIEAVKELDVKAHTLQAHISFYCTTVIGALEYASEITENHLTSLLPSVLKGLSSKTLDLCAAAMMITGQLVRKTLLDIKLLDALISKISQIPHPSMQNESIVLLILIFQTQSEILKGFPENSLKVLVSNKWIPSSIMQLSDQSIEVTAFCVPVVGDCLRRVQTKGDGWNVCKTFLENVLLEVQFKSEDAKHIIRTALDNYHVRKSAKPSKNEVIEIDSDDDDDVIPLEEDIQAWYSEFLQKLERQYPEEFDLTIKETMQGQGAISESRKQALKTVLAFRLKSSYNEDSVSIYENLYHHNSTNRIEAVKFLRKQMQSLAISENNKDLLKESISDRLSDDNPNVVEEVLKFPADILISTLGVEAVVDKLIEILGKPKSQTANWTKPILGCIQLLTNPDIFNECDMNKIILALIPFCFPLNKNEVQYFSEILSSKLCHRSRFLQGLASATNGKTKSYDIISSVENFFVTCEDLPSVDDILHSVQNNNDPSLMKSQSFAFFLVVLRTAYNKECSPETSSKIFDILTNFQKKHSFIMPENNDKWYILIREGKVHVKLYLDLIETIITKTQFSNFTDFDETSTSFMLILNIFEVLLTNSYTAKNNTKSLYTETLKNFLNARYASISSKLEFLSNFFLTERNSSSKICPEFQIRAIRLFSIVALSKTEKYLIDKFIVIKILIALGSRTSIVRTCSLDCLRILLESGNLTENYRGFVSKILSFSAEISLDHEQVAMILFIILCPNNNNSPQKASALLKKCTGNVLNEFLDVITSETTSNFLKAELLRVLRCSNNNAILKKLLAIGLEMIEHIETSFQASEDFVLDFSRGDILKFIIARFDESTIKLVTDNSTAWNIFERSLKLYNVLLPHESGIKSVAAIVMDIFDESIYERLSSKLKEKLVNLVINAVTFSEDISVSESGKKLMRRINLDGKHVEPILQKMKSVSNVPNTHKRSSRMEVPASDCLNSSDWKNGITLLEFLQNKTKFENFEPIISILFDILKLSLIFEEQSSLEYAKQLILSCLLFCCQKITTKGEKTFKCLSDNVFRIDLIVQSIRATQNPQTHHHALLLLSYCAKIFPNQVLHNMMDIFTFMGSSVSRHEDAFSFQIITNIIESIVPALVKMQDDADTKSNSPNNLVIPVLKVFSDVILDVPEHRRLPLYSKLLRTLGAKKYLWMFLCLVFESHVAHGDKEKVKHVLRKHHSAQEEFPKRIESALQITKDFEPDITVQTCKNLFEFLRDLPMEKADDEPMEVDISDVSLFNVASHTEKQLRHFKYTILLFVSSFTSSTQFVNRIAVLNDEDNKAMKSFYQSFIISILMYIPEVTAMEKNTKINEKKYWKVMLHHCYDILDNSISLLSPDMFLIVVHGLMQHKLPTVRKKVIELLISNLQYKTDTFAKCEDANFLKILEPLNKIIDSVTDRSIVFENATTNEIIFIQQIAIIAVKLLSKVLASRHPQEFKDLVMKLSLILKNRTTISKILLATAVLSLTEICSNLKAQSISLLSKFMPHLIGVLQDQAEILTTQSPDHLNIATITGVQKIFETLPLFLSPYMINILTTLCNIWARILVHENRDPKVNVAIGKLTAIWSKIASVIPLRVLIPISEDAYKRMIEETQFAEICYLMKLLTESFKTVSGQDIQPLQAELTSFFLESLEFRSVAAENCNQEITCKTEEHILEAFVALILKLSESSFRPLYHKVYDWAIRDAESKERTITYFLLSSKVAEALKSLFVLFAGDFVQDAADLLDKCNPSKSKELYFPDIVEKNSLLVDNILKTLYSVFVYDSKGFINAHRFDILMQPLVDQLESSLVLGRADIKALLFSCLSQLAVIVSNDTLWKQLNHQVLLKTRNNNSEIRIVSFECCVEIARKLGEDYSPLLPETIPFVAELLEDDNQEVEKSCRTGVRELESILGESLQHYF